MAVFFASGGWGRRLQLPEALFPSKWLLWACFAAVLLVILTTTPASPPDFTTVRDQFATSEARLLARDGTVLAVRRTDPMMRRLDWVPLAAISPALQRRIVAAEDQRFGAHRGIDWHAVGGAVRDRVHPTWRAPPVRKRREAR
jgi:penicillin-binding protein 1C